MMTLIIMGIVVRMRAEVAKVLIAFDFSPFSTLDYMNQLGFLTSLWSIIINLYSLFIYMLTVLVQYKFLELDYIGKQYDMYAWIVCAFGWLY